MMSIEMMWKTGISEDRQSKSKEGITPERLLGCFRLTDFVGGCAYKPLARCPFSHFSMLKATLFVPFSMTQNIF